MSEGVHISGAILYSDSFLCNRGVLTEADVLISRVSQLIYNAQIQTHLSSLSIVELVVVAGFEVDGHRAVRMLLDVASQYLLRDVVVVQLVVAHGQVDVESQHVSGIMEYKLW